MDPALRELLAFPSDETVEAVLRLEPGGDLPSGLRVVARFGDVVTCRLARRRISEVWADSSVASLKAPRLFGIDPAPESFSDESNGSIVDPVSFGDVRRPEDLAADGTGVIVAVIDWGFDFDHPNFIRDGATRILALWDQTADGPGPEPYGYGRVYERSEIDAAISSSRPYETLGYHPAKGDPGGRGAHGTHVLDIAAGNGAARGAPAGIASGADFLLVHLASRGTRGRTNLGDSVTLLEALDWIRQRAGRTPFVCNLSVGRHGGPHNGLTLVERGIDAMLTEAPGRCVVHSTGNYFHAGVHASGQLRPGQTRSLHWITDRSDTTPNELEIWYSRHDSMRVELRGPDDLPIVSLLPGQDQALISGGEKLGHVYHRTNDPAAGDTHVDIFLHDSAPAGTWTVSMIGEDVVDGRYNVWVERDAACPGCQSRLAPEDAQLTTTTGTVCNGFRSVVVGAYDAHDPDRQLARFSSSGPTVDGRVKPDLIAPGVRVLAARSSARDETRSSGSLTRMSGTSMAAPHVTGTIACMFEAAGRPLAIQETRMLLLSSAEPLGEHVSTADRARSGSGYLDVDRAVWAAAEIKRIGISLSTRASTTRPVAIADTVEFTGSDQSGDSDYTVALPAEFEDESSSDYAEQGSHCGCHAMTHETAHCACQNSFVEVVAFDDTHPTELDAEDDRISTGTMVQDTSLESRHRPLQIRNVEGESVGIAELFDGLSGYLGPTVQHHYGESFQVIAAPGIPIGIAPAPGDLVLTRPLCEGGFARASKIERADDWTSGVSTNDRIVVRIRTSRAAPIEAGTVGHSLEIGMEERPNVSADDLRARIDTYFDLAKAEYELPGKTITWARPQFRYAKAGGIEEAKKRLRKTLGAAFSTKNNLAIHNAVYGRAKPSEIATITQALISTGEFDAVSKANSNLTNEELVRKLQREFKIGMDCAGYVQLAFIFAFKNNDNDTPAVRTGLGLHERRGWEKLGNLPSSHFKKVKVTDAETGDLFILRPRADSRDQSWHTVIIVEHTNSGSKHTFLVDASWGTDLYGEIAGGVGRRKLMHDTSTTKWWDIHPLFGTEQPENDIGPYDGHPIHGMFRLR